MEDDITPAFELGDPLATRHTLTGVFVPGSKIALSAYKPVKWNTHDEPTEAAANEPVLIYMLQESTLFEEPILRGLLAEASTTFTTLQSLGQKAPKAEYVKISRAYRSIVRACIEKMELKKKSPEVQTDELRLERFTDAIATFYAAESLWHLFEILHMQPTHSQLIVPHLLEWTRFHLPNTEDRATDILLMAEEAYECDDYWNVLNELVMLGDLDIARAILALHRRSAHSAFKAAELILKNMPVYKEGYSLQKFRSQWEYWRVDAERKLSSHVFGAESQLEELIQLVTGNNERWDACLTQSKQWYEYLPGYLLYTNPVCKPFELRVAATSWMNRWSRVKPDWQLNSLSRMIMQLMEHDIKLFIYEIQKLNESHWFAMHLVDLIYQSGNLNAYCEQHRMELPLLRQSLIHDFGSYLMTTHNLWQLGIEYLDCCEEEGAAAIELLLPRIPIRTERQAFKIIAQAKQRGLSAVEQEICKVLSKRSYNENRHGNALEWAIRSKDTLLVTAIADFFLKLYSSTGHMLCSDVISSIGPRMFISPRLVFLSKYFEFYDYYRKCDFLSAAELLVNLLESKITPDYFWPSLLIDALPLLESEDPKILSKETVAILHHLETELVPLIERNKRTTANFTDQTSKTVLKDYRVENIEEILDLLRLACARNLARALIIENVKPLV